MPATPPRRIVALPPPLAAAASGDAAVASPVAALAVVLASALASGAHKISTHAHPTHFSVDDDGRGADAAGLAALAAPALGGPRGDAGSALAAVSCSLPLSVTSRARTEFLTHAVEVSGGRAVGPPTLVPPPGRLTPGTRVGVGVAGGVDEAMVQR